MQYTYQTKKKLCELELAQRLRRPLLYVLGRVTLLVARDECDECDACAMCRATAADLASWTSILPLRKRVGSVSGRLSGGAPLPRTPPSTLQRSRVATARTMKSHFVGGLPPDLFRLQRSYWTSDGTGR